MHLVHHQLRVSARVNNVIVNPTVVREWMKTLIKAINMEILYGPVAIYFDEMPGNIGSTAFAVIKTSHIALHTWNEETPGRLELDVYSCATFDIPTVLALIHDTFDAQEIRWTFDDREKERETWNN